MLDGVLLGHSRFCNKRKPPLSSLDTGADGICYHLPLKSAGGHCRSSAIRTVPGKAREHEGMDADRGLDPCSENIGLELKQGFPRRTKK